MNLLGFLNRKKIVYVENIGNLEYIKTGNTGFFATIDEKEVIGNKYELFFPSRLTNEISKYQIEYYFRIIDNWLKIKNEILEIVSNDKGIEIFELDIVSIPEYKSENYDAELNCKSGKNNFAVILKNVTVNEIIYHN